MIKNIFCLLNIISEYLTAIYRDLFGAYLMFTIKSTINQFERNNSNTYKEFQKIVKKNPNKTCLILNEKNWTFKQVLSLTPEVTRLLFLIFNL